LTYWTCKITPEFISPQSIAGCLSFIHSNIFAILFSSIFMAEKQSA